MNDEQLDFLLRELGNSGQTEPVSSVQLARRAAEIAEVRRRRRMRFRSTTTLLVCYVAGAASMWAYGSWSTVADNRQMLNVDADDNSASLQSGRESVPDEGDAEVQLVANDQVGSKSRILLPPSVGSGYDPKHRQSGVELKDAADLYEVFRKLGNSSHARGDVRSATQYYRMAVDAATPRELRASVPGDTQLLLALKRERYQAGISVQGRDAI